MKKNFILPLACVIIVFLSLLSFAASHKREGVTFNATYSTTSERLQAPPMLKMKITGLGTSNELNITKFVAVSTQDRTTPPPFKLSGTCSWYAKDGDTFTSSFAGTATPGPDSTLVVAMTSTINGGTGKFAHAKGTIEGKSVVDPKKTVTTLDCKGEISY